MKRFSLLFSTVLCVAGFMAPLTEAAAAIPLVVNHQGRIIVGAIPFSGVGAFRFALVDTVAGTNLWTNDGSMIGTSQRPDVAVDVTVIGGVYSVGLGNTTVPGMSAMPSSVFDGAEVALRIWFDDGVNGSQYLTPDQPMSSAAYAFHALASEDADTVDGVHAADLEESAEIAAAVAAHTEDAVAHTNIELDAARITTGALDLARVPQGGGSGLNADLLDGQHASAFMIAGTDNWVNTSGDTMTGPLTINQSVGQPLIQVTNTWTTAIQGVSNNHSGKAIVGSCSGTLGRGVYGECTSETNNINYGGYFVARGDQARAVYGAAESETTMTKYGGYFFARGGNGIGCRGEASGDSGKGVYGYATSEGVTTNYGGYFYARGTTGRGCYASGKAYAYYASSTGADYGPFTGAHEARIAPDSLPLMPGMVVSATGSAAVRADEKGKPTLSSTMPEVTVSTAPNDPAVLGVFVMESPLEEDHWYAAKADERFAVVNALGEGRVWVCNANGPVRLGDYVTTSAVPGYAQRQDDDLLHNYTLGKVIESVDWDSATETVTVGSQTYTVYLAAVVYTSG
jgi:hypothetical protein